MGSCGASHASASSVSEGKLGGWRTTLRRSSFLRWNDIPRAFLKQRGPYPEGVSSGAGTPTSWTPHDEAAMSTGLIPKRKMCFLAVVKGAADAIDGLGQCRMRSDRCV